MLNRSTHNILGHTLAGIAFLTLSLGVVSRAAPEPNPKVSLKVSLGNATHSLGEPIIIRYTLDNPGTTDILPKTHAGSGEWIGKNEEKWFELKGVDSAGKIVPGVDALSASYKGPFMGGTRIPAKTVCTGSVIISHWDATLKPGSYVLSMRVNLPTKVIEASAPMTITAADPAHLRTEASAWRTAVLETTDTAKQESLMKQLFALPEENALPEWQRLITDEALSGKARVLAAEEVSHLDTPAAIDLMGQLCWDPHDRSDEGTPMMLYISGMWLHGDVPTKHHIEKLAAEHGEKMPFVPLMRL